MENLILVYKSHNCMTREEVEREPAISKRN